MRGRARPALVAMALIAVFPQALDFAVQLCGVGLYRLRHRSACRRSGRSVTPLGKAVDIGAYER